MMSPIAQLSNVLMQGHCNWNGCFGYVSENLVSIQKSFSKLTALPQAWHKTIFKFKPKTVLVETILVTLCKWGPCMYHKNSSTLDFHKITLSATHWRCKQAHFHFLKWEWHIEKENGGEIWPSPYSLQLIHILLL